MLVSPASVDFSCSASAEVNAGDPRRSEQLGEAAFACGRAEWHAVQQNLVARRAEEQAAADALVERAFQFLPGRVELCAGASMPEFIQACEFQQNVQAPHKGPGRRSCIDAHKLRSRRGNPIPTLLP
jgi:hypothetical protein